MEVLSCLGRFTFTTGPGSEAATPHAECRVRACEWSIGDGVKSALAPGYS